VGGKKPCAIDLDPPAGSRQDEHPVATNQRARLRRMLNHSIARLAAPISSVGATNGVLLPQPAA
jgi:hypothetical protein